VEGEDFEGAADLSAKSDSVRRDVQAAEQEVQAAEEDMQAAVSMPVDPWIRKGKHEHQLCTHGIRNQAFIRE
jgi:hypothetical protein